MGGNAVLEGIQAVQHLRQLPAAPSRRVALDIPPNRQRGKEQDDGANGDKGSRPQIQREGKEVVLSVSVPETMTGRIILPSGWTFEDGKNEKLLENGKFTVNNRDFS